MEVNDINIITKNLKKDLFFTCSKKLMGDKLGQFGTNRKNVRKYISPKMNWMRLKQLRIGLTEKQIVT